MAGLTKQKVNQTRFKLLGLTLALGSLIAMPGCQAQPRVKNQQFQVVATTTIVGDVVRQVGHDSISLKILLPIGADPHDFEPTPQDVATVARAKVIFINGAGLETFLNPLLKNAGNKAQVVSLAENLTLHRLGNTTDGLDPHVWFDPNNVIKWTETINQTLSRLDPDHADIYADNAKNYQTGLEKLNQWIEDQVALVPPNNRNLVTDHRTFGYFADRFGFTQKGVVFPGFSTLTEPSAQERASLEKTIWEFHIPAIFVGTTVNPNLVNQITNDTNTKLVFLYTDSLSQPGGEADTYLKMMRYNVIAIINALK